MTFKLPNLDYAATALEPYMSAETLEFHHGLHHNAYITNTNNMVAGTAFEGKSLEEIILATAGDATQIGLFNNAAQSWNHAISWKLLSPKGGKMPNKLEAKIIEDFGSVDAFKEAFLQAGMTQFGSGWAWLVLNNGKLEIMKTANAHNPLPEKKSVVFTIDVWEHAYYIDYRNRRADFLKAILDNIANWEYAEELMLKA